LSISGYMLTSNQRPSAISCSTCTFRTILWLKGMTETNFSNGIHREKWSISPNPWDLPNTWRWLNPYGMWGWDVSLKCQREAQVEGRWADSFLDGWRLLFLPGPRITRNMGTSEKNSIMLLRLLVKWTTLVWLTEHESIFLLKI